MNEAKAFLAANDLNGAIQAAINHVRSKPTDMTARTFLFELLIFSGEWERAEKQLDVLGQQDANAVIGSQIYRQCIQGERERKKVFASESFPVFLNPPPEYVNFLLQGVRLINEGKLVEAREKLDTAEAERAVFSGKLNGNNEFQDFRDYNDLTSSVLEVFLQGQYVWLPLTQIRRLEIIKPQSLRDLCWTQAKIESIDGTSGEVFIPALYPNTYQNADDQIRLGRMTDWQEIGEEIFIGGGTRIFWVDGADTPLFEVEKIEFNEAPQVASAVQ
jgi:type VI secretion system protein ImpE